MCASAFLSRLRGFVFVFSPPYLIFFQRRQRVVAERSVSQTGRENILPNENPSCFICFQSNNKKKREKLRGEHSREVLYLKNPDVQNGSLSCLPLCRPRPLAVVNPQSDFSSQRWFIGTMCAVALLTLVALVACFVRRNKGGKYAGTPPPKQQDMFPMEKGQFVFNRGWVLLLFPFRTETLCF